MIDPKHLSVNLDAFETGIAIDLERPGLPSLTVCEVWPLSKLDGDTHIRDDKASVDAANRIVAMFRACEGISTEALNAGYVKLMADVASRADGIVTDLDAAKLSDEIPAFLKGGYDQWNGLVDAVVDARIFIQRHCESPAAE